MSRLRRIEQQDRFFFVTTNLAKGVAELTPAERSLILKVLDSCRGAWGFRIFAYVVMPNHMHLLIEPAANTLTSIMRDFKSKSGLLLNKNRRTKGPIWQSRFFDFICRRARDFSAKTDYIHHNPVAKGLSAQPEGWIWSSAGFLVNRGNSLLVPDWIDPPTDSNTLLWLAPWR